MALRTAGLKLPAGFALWPAFVSASEHSELWTECMHLLRKESWQESHADRVCVHYRETLASSALDAGSHGTRCMQKMLARALPLLSGVLKRALRQGDMLPPHILHLSSKGHIGYHVDSYAGPLIAAVSLGEERVLGLRPRHCTDAQVEIPLPPQSLYVQAGDICSSHEHAILPSRAENGLDSGRISIVWRLKDTI